MNTRPNMDTSPRLDRGDRFSRRFFSRLARRLRLAWPLTTAAGDGPNRWATGFSLSMAEGDSLEWAPVFSYRPAEAEEIRPYGARC